MPARKKWWTEAVKTIDGSRDYVILENPAAVKSLDELLVKDFWPIIQKKLIDSGYAYGPDEPETEFELAPELTRSMSFVLFGLTGVFFRGELRCSTAGWMLERKFFLGLDRDHDPNLIFEILGNSRFRGNPPTLTVDKEGVDFYQITLYAGDGAGWGLYDSEEVRKRIEGVIEASLSMYEMVQYGDLPTDKLGEFLTLAYTAYEAY
jgi:hypothetical protein